MKRHLRKLNDTLEKGQQWLRPKRGGRRVVMDDRLIRREYYNPNRFAVIFELIQKEIPYITGSMINPGLPVYKLEPGKFLILPHAFFMIRAADPGVEIFNLITNFGAAIGKGNTLPSPPEVFVKKHF